MNKVVYIDQDEEIIGIIDIIGNISEDKIALVIPTGALLFSSSVNMRLLKEKSKEIKKDISIVTSDMAGRNIASQVGFTVYETLGEARDIKEKDREEREKEAPSNKRLDDLEEKEEVIGEEGAYTDVDRKNPNIKEQPENKTQISNDGQPKKKNKASGFQLTPKHWVMGGIGVVVILFLITFIFPKATIYLDVYTEETEVDIKFNLAAGGGDDDTVPAIWESITKDISVKVKATGEKNIGDKATGTVTLYNRSGRTQVISGGSEFIAQDGKVFINPEESSVPGAIVSDFGELIPGKSSVTLEARDGGGEYNIRSTRLSIPSLDQLTNLVYAIAEEGFLGGTDKQAKVVTEDDIKYGKEKASDEAKRVLEEEFGIKGDKIFVQGLAVSEVTEEKVSKEVDEEADEFEVTIKAKYSFLSFQRDEFDKLFEKNIELQVSDNKELIGEGYNSVTWKVISFDQEAKTAEVVGETMVLTATRLNEEFIKSQITSLDITELRIFLSKYDEVDVIRVRFFPPFLLGSVPANERNIEIKVRYTTKNLSIKKWDLNTG